MYCRDLKELKQSLLELSSGIAVVYAAEKGFDFLELQKTITSVKVDVVGGFYPGLITSKGLNYEGYIIQYHDVNYEYTICDSTDKEPTIVFSKVKSGTGLVITDSLADGNQNFLDALYHSLGIGFRFIGTGAGSLDLIQKPCVFDKDGIYLNKAIVIALEQSVAIGIKHGFERLAGPLIVTKSKQSVINELNWDNAYSTYAELIEYSDNQSISKSEFFESAKGYPLGISRKGHEDIVRDPISVDSLGNITCIDEIPENAALYLLKGESSKLINAARESCEEALRKVGGIVENCLLIDCVSRVLFLEDKFQEEIDVASEVLTNKYPDLAVEGILSIGEISTFDDGKLEIYNKTFLTAILNNAV